MSKKMSILKQYILNTSFHGYRFILEDGRHWTERVFWIICCTLSWIATFFLIWSSWYDFQNNAISFVVDTNYLDWDTDFPSVIICETDNARKIAEVTDRVFGDPHDYNLDEVVKELVYFKGFSFYTLQTCGLDIERNENCFLKNFSYFSKEVTSSCKEIMKKCSWNNGEFDCCQYFREIDSEIGICYGLNSIQTRVKNPPIFPMESNKKTGPGSLYLEINGFANVYTFGHQEVPSLTSNPYEMLPVAPHVQYERHFFVKEIENEPEVKEVSIEQRKCHFSEESDLDVYKYYSFNACGVQCRKQAELKTCGCAHHLKPNTPFNLHCNIEGISCLSQNYNSLSVLKAPWSNKTGLVCDCLPSCTEIEMSIIRDEKSSIEEDYAIVKLIMDRLPTERFKRNVVKGKLDLVVSMGGATALFLGASILSFVEIAYFFIVKPFVDMVKENPQRI